MRFERIISLKIIIKLGINLICVITCWVSEIFTINHPYLVVNYPDRLCGYLKDLKLVKKFTKFLGNLKHQLFYDNKFVVYNLLPLLMIELSNW